MRPHEPLSPRYGCTPEATACPARIPSCRTLGWRRRGYSNRARIRLLAINELPCSLSLKELGRRSHINAARKPYSPASGVQGSGVPGHTSQNDSGGRDIEVMRLTPPHLKRYGRTAILNRALVHQPSKEGVKHAGAQFDQVCPHHSTVNPCRNLWPDTAPVQEPPLV